MEIPLLMWVLACPLTALVIGMVSPQLREAIQAFCEQISGLIEGLYEFAQNGLKNIVGWLLTLSEKPKPLPSLFGLIILAIAVLDSSLAEFPVARKTIGVVLPWGEEAPKLAFALVGLTAATGILAHLANGGLKKASLVLAILLVMTQGFLAYLRASESLPLAGQNDEFDRDEGGLIIEGIDGQVNDFQTPATTVTSTPPSIFNPTVLLATTAAVLFSSAAVVTFWGGTVLAGSFLTWMVCWLVGGVVLAIWFVPTALLFPLHLIVNQGQLTRVILTIAETIFAICGLPLKAIERLHPDSFRRRRWKSHQEKISYRDFLAHAPQKALHEQTIETRQRAHELAMQQLEHKYQLSQLETLVESSHLHKEASLERERQMMTRLHQMADETGSRIETEFRKELPVLIESQIADVTEILFDSTLGPIKMINSASQLQEALNAQDSSGNHNPKRTKGVENENATRKESPIDASTSAN